MRTFLRRSVLPVLLLAALFTAQSHSALVASGALTEAERLAALGRVWGLLKYYHPDVAGGTIDWDQALVDAIAKITPQPIKYVVICSDHGDHTAGNALFPAGVTYIVHPTSKATLERQAVTTSARGGRQTNAWTLPANAEVVADKKVLKLGGEEIQVLFLGRAHTGGDLNVLLPKERVLFMSEAYLNRVFPAMRSAYPSEWVAAIKKAEAMPVDRYVPGHGFTEDPKTSREELVSYRKAVEAVIAEATRLHAAAYRAHGVLSRGGGSCPGYMPLLSECCCCRWPVVPMIPQSPRIPGRCR
jgi:glyoxylase-like metal-dependent hydrolase (beta-lactamase superfamily II)